MNPCPTCAPRPTLSMQHMRWVSGLEGEQDLVAYWKFNDAGGCDPCALTAPHRPWKVVLDTATAITPWGGEQRKKTARSAARQCWVLGVEGEQDLAYWKFNDAGGWDPFAVSGVPQTLEG